MENLLKGTTNRLDFWTRLHYKISRKTLLDEGVVYKYYAVRWKRGPFIIQAGRTHDDLVIIPVAKYLRRFKDQQPEIDKLTNLGFENQTLKTDKNG